MFNPDVAPKTETFEQIPDGVYTVTIIEASHEKSDYGYRFNFTFIHPEGPYKNRKSWARHIYKGTPTTNPELVKRQSSLLADLFFCIGGKGFDTEDEANSMCEYFIGQDVVIKLESYENKTTGKTYQDCKGYWKLDGSNRSGLKMPTSVPAKKASPKQPEIDSDVPF